MNISQSSIFNLQSSITPALSIPKAFMQAAAHYGDKVALREKEYGIWRPLTWREYLVAVQQLTLGLHQLGIQRDDKVVLIGSILLIQPHKKMRTAITKRVLLNRKSETNDITISDLIVLSLHP